MSKSSEVLRPPVQINAAFKEIKDAQQRAFQKLHREIGVLARNLPPEVSEIPLSLPRQKYTFSPDYIDEYYSPHLNAIIRRTQLHYIRIEDYKDDLPDDPDASTRANHVILTYPIVTNLEVLGPDDWIRYGEKITNQITQKINEARQVKK